MKTRTDQQTKPTEFDFEAAFSRNYGLLTHDEMVRLQNTCVAIPGCGGVGGAYIEVLARQGIGRFKLADFDRFELPNLNRQFGAFMSTMNHSKLEVSINIIRDINPEARIQGYPKGIHEDNIDHFLNGADVVLDSLDGFAIETRVLLFRKAWERGIPVITAGPMGFGAALQIVDPDGMSFDEFYGIKDEMSHAEKLVRFAIGVAPKRLHNAYLPPSRINVKAEHMPSSSLAMALCAAVVGMTVLKIVLGWGGVRALPYYAQYDMKRGIWHEGILRGGHRNLLQRIKLMIGRWQIKKLLREVSRG